MALVVNQYFQDVPHTSEIEFFSSLHGREKRLERGIDKRDLQSAVKYGVKSKAHDDPRTGATRWKYTLGNLVYITDVTSTKEITSYCYPVDIPLAALTPFDLFEHERAKENLRKHPNLCTSHTVIIVDHSRSMGTSDVTNHENRIKASFGTLALDFVAKQVLTRNACNTDVVSVMLMHDGVDVLFEREPMGLSLYNRFVEIHHKVRPRSHGNFMPSLDQAERLLGGDANQPGTALCLLFLSDGKPSDNATGILRGNCRATAEAISNRMSLLAANFGQRLSVSTVGFAGIDQDFSVLVSMAEAAQSAGAMKADFIRPELSSAGLASAIASAVSSLTDTKSHLSMTLMAAPAGRPSQRGGGWGRPPPIAELPKESATCEHPEGWAVYVDQVRRWQYAEECLYGMEKIPWKRKEFVSPAATGIAIRKTPFGEGAERVVYKMQEYDMHRNELVGGLFVAKYSKSSSPLEDQVSVETAAKALADAGSLANVFNMQVQNRLSICLGAPGGWAGRIDQRVWGVQFLTCSVYRYLDNNEKEHYVLAEKWLEPLAYKKWNSNNGYVFRGRGHASLQSPSPRTAAQQAASHAHADRLMGEAAAEDAFDRGTGTAEECILGNLSRKRGRDHISAEFQPRPTDYLQAFSHFSYVYSERKMLVCDLQGVMSHDSPADPRCAGVFELTDPVIHFQSKVGRKQVYGRTDLGRKGMREFFRTHECNDVCRLLCLPGSRSAEDEAAARATRDVMRANAAWGTKRPRVYFQGGRCWNSVDSS